ncbi:ABC transporter substrate-binding protein [Kribbella sandramycini]|uniref:ABC transporter substrate-binding protein n=1 Tax=Kribbella sandramycini TaxID=60450 RepID=A0A7Y4L4S8_9ACTN|nr:ABC transporter substrate-binding protein [Kribbella sandramycini]MBB6571201.1 iron complex transport system substrate-binding protein [Kribbella sandramycini]NOL43392.1 ABC transporter substrate-binding protein [Kribbella sandramycini]
MTTTPLKRRGAAAAAAVLSLALVLTACGGGDDKSGAATGDKAAETRTVTAANGAVTIPAAPQRVVTIGNTDLPFIDMGGKPVGVTGVPDSDLALLPPEQRATWEKAENLGDEVDLEKVAALKPDLILVQIPDAEFKKMEKQLTTIAPTVFWGLDTEWKALAEGLGEAGNVKDALGKQKAEFEGDVAKMKQTYADVIKNTKFVNLDRYSNSDPGTYVIGDIGCVEIAQDDVGLNFPKAPAGKDPLAYESLPFEQLSKLSQYDVITYPADDKGQATQVFAPVVATNTWKALPTVTSGRALGVFCPGNNSYGAVLRYLDSLDKALATLPAKK